MMKKKMNFDPQMSVAELLRDWPQVIPVFLKYHMACVGCSMSTFETLKDAARIYGISQDVFFNALSDAVDVDGGISA
jgi:hybrid cluster-associated redox disulfide protein